LLPAFFNRLAFEAASGLFPLAMSKNLEFMLTDLSPFTDSKLLGFEDAS
jgi:hypothetical protein